MDQHNTNSAQHNMLFQQIRTWDITEPHILDLFASLPRTHFVPESYQDFAFADMLIPLGHGQMMLPPKEQARIMQALAVQPTEIVLEVGTGYGYTTALLAKQAHHVYSFDTETELAQTAAQRLLECSIENVHIATENESSRWEAYTPFDVIMINGSLPYLPQAFINQLNVGGRLFAVIGEGPAMHATLFTRKNADDIVEQVLFETQLPQLPQGPHLDQFHF